MRSTTAPFSPYRVAIVFPADQPPERMVVLQPGAVALAEVAPAAESERASILGALPPARGLLLPANQGATPLPLHRFDAKTRGKSPVR